MKDGHLKMATKGFRHSFLSLHFDTDNFYKIISWDKKELIHTSAHSWLKLKMISVMMFGPDSTYFSAGEDHAILTDTKIVL